MERSEALPSIDQIANMCRLLRLIIGGRRRGGGGGSGLEGASGTIIMVVISTATLVVLFVLLALTLALALLLLDARGDELVGPTRPPGALPIVVAHRHRLERSSNSDGPV